MPNKKGRLKNFQTAFFVWIEELTVFLIRVFQPGH